MQHIHIQREFPVPVQQLFAHLAEHENLGRLFAPARVTRLRHGFFLRNGVGSARLVRPGPGLAFVETVTGFEANELIEYRITKGGPLKDHHGRMVFTSLGARASRVEFEIRFAGKLPGVGPLFRFIISRGIQNGLFDLEDDESFIRPPADASWLVDQIPAAAWIRSLAPRGAAHAPDQ